MRKIKIKKESIINDEEIHNDLDHYITIYALTRFVGISMKYFKMNKCDVAENIVKIDDKIFIKDVHKKYEEILKRCKKLTEIKLGDIKNRESLESKKLQKTYNLTIQIKYEAYRKYLAKHLINIDKVDKDFILETFAIFDILRDTVKTIEFEKDEMKYLKTIMTKFDKYIRTYFYDLITEDIYRDTVIQTFQSKDKKIVKMLVDEYTRKVKTKGYKLSSKAKDFRENTNIVSCLYAKSI